MKDDAIVIEQLPADFAGWDELLALILGSFDYMDELIDPPSSAKRLTPQGLAQKATEEVCFVALRGGRVVGCVFAAERSDCVYVGKLAILPVLQRQGIGRRLLAAADEFARARGKPALELQTRVELTSNHAAFARLGFREIGRSGHPGYDRPTTITMRKML